MLLLQTSEGTKEMLLLSHFASLFQEMLLVTTVLLGLVSTVSQSSGSALREVLFKGTRVCFLPARLCLRDDLLYPENKP